MAATIGTRAAAAAGAGAGAETGTSGGRPMGSAQNEPSSLSQRGELPDADVVWTIKIETVASSSAVQQHIAERRGRGLSTFEHADVVLAPPLSAPEHEHAQGRSQERTSSANGGGAGGVGGAAVAQGGGISADGEKRVVRVIQMRDSWPTDLGVHGDIDTVAEPQDPQGRNAISASARLPSRKSWKARPSA